MLQKVHGYGFLEQCLPFVLLVGQDAIDGRYRPPVLSPWVLYLLLVSSSAIALALMLRVRNRL